MIGIYADDLSACQGQFGDGLNALISLALTMLIEAAALTEDQLIQKRIKNAMLRYRELKGWNQARMALFVGTSKANYQKYESLTEKREVPLGVILRFAEQIGTTVEELAHGPRQIRA